MTIIKQAKYFLTYGNPAMMERYGNAQVVEGVYLFEPAMIEQKMTDSLHFVFEKTTIFVTTLKIDGGTIVFHGVDKEF